MKHTDSRSNTLTELAKPKRGSCLSSSRKEPSHVEFWHEGESNVASIQGASIEQEYYVLY